VVVYVGGIPEGKVAYWLIEVENWRHVRTDIEENEGRKLNRGRRKRKRSFRKVWRRGTCRGGEKKKKDQKKKGEGMKEGKSPRQLEGGNEWNWVKKKKKKKKPAKNKHGNPATRTL